VEGTREECITTYHQTEEQHLNCLASSHEICSRVSLLQYGKLWPPKKCVTRL